MTITVYSKPQCPNCVIAKNLLNSNGVEFRELTLGVDFTREEFVEGFPTVKQFPHIVRGDESIGGVSALLSYLSGKSV